MRRREALAGIGALGMFGLGAATAFTDFDVTDPTGSDDDEGNDGPGGDVEGETVDPLDLPTFDAPGSEQGTEQIPDEGRVSYISVFATWCDICETKMAPLGRAYDALEEDVQFVSVTNEPVGSTVDPADVADWWDEHGGSWTVAHDDDLDLTVRMDAQAVPFSIVVDADNRVTWSSVVTRQEATGDYEETVLDRIREAQ